MPLYKAGIPPSVLYMMVNVSHKPGSLARCAVLRAAKEADWIDNRVLTMSSGYVKQTEVMPAAPPHIRRRKELRSWPGEASKNLILLVRRLPQAEALEQVRTQCRPVSYLFVEVVAPKLYSGVWYDPNAIGPIAPHKATPTLVLPHLHKALAYRELILFSANGLYLKKNLQSLEG